MGVSDYPPEFWFAAALAVTLVGIAKAGFGSGPAFLATPLVALTIPVADAAALLLPLLLIADLFSMRQYRGEYDRQSLVVLIPSAVVGIAIGGFFFDQFSSNERIMQVGIGLLALSFVAFQMGRTMIFGALEGRRFPLPIGWGIGVFGGFASTLAHAGGPVITIYVLPQRLPRNIYVGTTVIIFLVINLIKLVPYGMLGLLRVGNLLAVLLLSPLAYIGVRLGVYLNQNVSERWFNRVIYAILTLTAIQLILGRSLLSFIMTGK